MEGGKEFLHVDGLMQNLAEIRPRLRRF